MLLQGLHRLREATMETALLGVDSENPNQAKSLYDSVGFQVKESSVTYQKQLEQLMGTSKNRQRLSQYEIMVQ
jgi:ribosomal protein S18 acetylase RimI-like enzyme